MGPFEPQTEQVSFRLSSLRDICVPIAVAVVPALLFMLLGVATRGLDKPNADIPVWRGVAIGVLETAGIVSMAIVILLRYGSGVHNLSAYTNGRPPAWRKFVLVLSIAFILLFDILVNVGSAFAGAGFLFFASIPAFIAYIACYRLAFVRL